MRSFLTTSFILLCCLSASAQWTTICNTGNGFVVDLAAYHGDIYATGFFTEDCGGTAAHINKWQGDGTSWTAIDTGIADPGHRISIINDTMYVAKYQQAADTNWVYKWDGAHFARSGDRVYLTTAVAGFSKTPSIYDIVSYHGQLVISGEFDRASDLPISGIARWTGTRWDSLGSGLGGSVTSANVLYPHQMMVYHDTLYVVGNFVTAGGITANGVAMWDGTQWHAMGAGFNGNVYAITVYNGAVYAGGGFTRTGTTPMYHVAMWNGSSWVSPGFGVYDHLTGPDDAYVHTLKVVGTRLFISGGFTHVLSPSDTEACNNIIAWDGTAFNTMSGGTPNYQIEGIVAYGTNSILVGGGYNNDSSYIARYDLTALDVPTANQPAQQLTIYPMPAHDHITIEGLAPGSIVELLDMPGRTVRTLRHDAGTATMDIAGLPTGTYLLRTTGNRGINTRLVVKQ